MANYLSIINGVARSSVLPGTTLIYDQTVSGPVTSGTPIMLPGAGSYTLNTNSVPNLNVYLNGQKLIYPGDWTTSGTGPIYTDILVNADLDTGDVLDLRIERNS